MGWQPGEGRGTGREPVPEPGVPGGSDAFGASHALNSPASRGETARLLALGAVQVSQWLECHVLRAPGGHLLCVIPVHSDPGAFKAQATTWP